jgi:ketol-acid reductoisomerase
MGIREDRQDRLHRPAQGNRSRRAVGARQFKQKRIKQKGVTNGENRFWRNVEDVIMSDEFTLEKAREILQKETIAVLGYGVQGPAQALNLRDNGIDVIIGQLEGDEYWEKAMADGFVPGKTCFPWKKPQKKEPSSNGAAVRCRPDRHVAHCQGMPQRRGCLYFSHGFSIVYKDQTGMIPPKTWT